MLRITETQENQSATRLRLDGTVSSECFADDLIRVCERHRHRGKILLLDLAGVTFMTYEAARQVAALRNDEFRIINCSPFIAALLEAVETSE